EIGRQVKSAELHRAADAQACFHRSDDETVAGECQLALHVETADRQGRIIAAFRIERHSIAKTFSDVTRPRTGHQDEMRRPDFGSVLKTNARPATARSGIHNLGLKEA